MKRVEFHPEAAAELTAAARYYESEAPGLGADLLNLVEVACERLAVFPDLGRPFGSRLRRLVLPRFPYAVIYRIDDAALTIVAGRQYVQAARLLARSNLSVLHKALQLTGPSPRPIGLGYLLASTAALQSYRSAGPATQRPVR